MRIGRINTSKYGTPLLVVSAMVELLSNDKTSVDTLCADSLALMYTVHAYASVHAT